MSYTKSEVSLLEYVMAYLQEEWNQEQGYHGSMATTQEYVQDWVKVRVTDAMDAYEGGAR